ncbi:unnamed protein product [Rhizophagus irregularis]|nr:unnamed protein product [Rhizophagus irregularis]
MANLMDEITIGEWHQTLELVNTNSAPGPSGIEYAIIKHFSDKASYILLKFINMSLKIGSCARPVEAVTYPPDSKTTKIQLYLGQHASHSIIR